MKLCKDCKHVQHVMYQVSYCTHPNANRDVVDGSPTTLCIEARGAQVGGATDRSICWPDAKLFEQAPPAEPEPPKPYTIVPVEIDIRKGFFERLFGWL